MVMMISVDLEPQVKKFLHSSLIHACGNIGMKSDGVVDTLLRCLATPPSITTLRFNTLKYTTDDVISSIKPMIDEVFDERGALPPQINQHPVINDIVIVPGIGPQRTITPEGKKIIVGLLCGLAVMRGAQVFAPGVMGAPKSLSKGDLVCVFADIEGKCCKGLTTFYDGHTFFVGNGIAMQNRSDWFGIDASNSGVAVKMTQPLYIAPCLDIKNELCDMLYPQNLPSIVVSHVLSPAPGEIVLDMCASPGGKTTHIATLMKNTGCVIAIDKTPSKIVKLKENVAKFCSSIVHCFLFDSTVLISNDIQFIINPEAPFHPPYLPETFDKVLLDAPCSGLGQRPQLKYSLKLSEYCSYQVYQRKLIKQAVNSLKRGGILVYSTCTISPDENESQVYWILKTFPDLQLSEQSPIVGYPGLPGYGLNMEQCSKLQRFGPYEFFKSLSVDPLCDNVCDTIGFFIAKFIKM